MAEDLKARLRAAIERSEQARSGRIRVEQITRHAESLGGDSETSISDFLFDEASGAIEQRDEGSWPLKKYSRSTEQRVFRASQCVYIRQIEVGSRFLEPEQVADGIPEQFDDTHSPSADLWVRHGPQEMGDVFADMFSNRIHYEWLRAALEDPATPIREVSHTSAESVLELWFKRSLLDDAKSADILPARVTLVDEALSLISTELPAQDQHNSAISFTIREWRMGEPVRIEEPGPAECRPEREPVYTQIERIETTRIERVVGFSHGGADWAVVLPWSREGEEIDEGPYHELQAGDRIRIWGESHRLSGQDYYDWPFDPAIVPGAAPFVLWCAEYEDGGKLYHSRPEDIDDLDESLLLRYNNIDVHGELVTLNLVVITEEPIIAHFVDDVGQKCDDILLGTAAIWDAENMIPLDRPTIEAHHLIEGSPVVVRTAEQGRDVYIWRVELADGTPIYPLASPKA
jgi:hypothetical protein